MPLSSEEILDSTLDVLRSGRAVSLDVVAGEIGLSKAGVMHHFRTKRELMLGVVDRVAARWHEALVAELGGPVGVPAPERIGAYARLALSWQHDEADIAMLADPRLRSAMTQRWVEHLRPWVHLDDVPPGPQHVALTAARLIADGAWFDDAADAFPVDDSDRPGLLALIDELIERGQA